VLRKIRGALMGTVSRRDTRIARCLRTRIRVRASKLAGSSDSSLEFQVLLFLRVFGSIRQ
jgi:hypothetical protein